MPNIVLLQRMEKGKIQILGAFNHLSDALTALDNDYVAQVRPNPPVTPFVHNTATINHAFAAQGMYTVMATAHNPTYLLFEVNLI